MRIAGVRRDLPGLVIAVCGVAALASFWLAPPRAVPTGDERDYLQAAAHLARSGVFSRASLETAVPPRDAYREPGYSFLLGVTWRLVRAELPGEEPGPWAKPSGAAARAVGVLGALLLAATAVAAGFAARHAGASGRASLAAAVLVVASPALRQAALVPGSEGLGAALVTLAGCGLGLSVARGGAGALALAGLAAGFCPLARGAGIALVPAGVLVLLLLPGSLAFRRRAQRAAVFACLALTPLAIWMTRNHFATGHFVLTDRSGAVLWTRAELDRQIAREGLLPALFAWTPLESARRAGERIWPEATYSRYRWKGEGNYFTRSLRSWNAARLASADPLQVDLSLGREALGQFLRRPREHGIASLAVGWRGLFAERSPALLVPVDLTFGLGLLLAGAFAGVVSTAVRSRHVVPLALLAGPVALFLVHAVATEFLPRFGVPGLPLVWAALLATLSRARAPKERGMEEVPVLKGPHGRVAVRSGEP